MSQEDLAFESGLHRTYISGIERGIRNVGLDNIGGHCRCTPCGACHAPDVGSGEGQSVTNKR